MRLLSDESYEYELAFIESEEKSIENDWSLNKAR